MNTEDLNALDRTTLRVWRIWNLLGWGALGAVAGIVTFVLSARTLAGVLIEFLDLPGLGVALLVCLAAGAAVDGVIVGNHVYRSPAWVAAIGILAPASVFALNTPIDGPVESAIVLAGPVGGAVMATLVARARFRRRPRALRAPAA